MRLLLLRHGQDIDGAMLRINGRRDPELSELGRRQAAAAIETLRNYVIDDVCVSPLRRARETAAIVSGGLSLASPSVVPDLIERDYGALTGCAVSEIPAVATEIVRHGSFRYVVEAPGIETYPALHARAGNALRQIEERYAARTVLAVAHNEILKMLRANFEKRSWEEELRHPPLANCEVIVLGDATTAHPRQTRT